MSVIAQSSNTLPGCYNITVYKGDSFKETAKVRDANRDPIDLSGATVTLTIKKERTDTTAALILTEGDGITIGGADNNEIDINKIITLAARDYYYDLQIVFSDDSVRTILTGVFEVVQDVTT